MDFPTNFLENIVTAVVSGGGTALSASFAFARDFKSRLEKLETRAQALEASYSKIASLLEGWKIDPPDWAGRGNRVSRLDLEDIQSLEIKVNGMNRKLKDLEEEVDRLRSRSYLSVQEEDFEAADRDRAEDIAKLRVSMAEISGLLKGLQSALGLPS